MKKFNNDHEFDSFLRGKLKQASLSSPNHEGAWDAISNNLAQMPGKERKTGRVIVLVLPILALLLYYGMFYAPTNIARVAMSQLPMTGLDASAVNRLSASNFGNSKENIEGDKVPQLHSQKPNRVIASNEYMASKTDVFNGKQLILLQKQPISKENSGTLHTDGLLVKQGPRARGMNIPLLADLNGVLASLPTQNIKEEPSQATLKWPKNAYVGIHRNITNSWILNQNTYQIFGSDYLGLAMYWGGSWGNHVGWDLRKNVTIEIGANWLASHGQTQRDLKFGRKASFEVDMLYHQFPILIKRKHTPIILGRRVTAYAEGGIQYARLLLARQQVNHTDKGGIYTRFNEDEVSILAGYSMDIPLSPRFFLNTALRGRISNNINAKDWRIKGDYGKSHNLAIGLTVGLNYRLTPLK